MRVKLRLTALSKLTQLCVKMRALLAVNRLLTKPSLNKMLELSRSFKDEREFTGNVHWEFASQSAVLVPNK